MAKVVFKTPGLIDKKSFIVSGLNFKPNAENPIGYFGTGLKMAIAVILREKLKLEVWIGEDRYTFYTYDESFRNEYTYTAIKMKRERFSLGSLIGRAQIQELPYTTQLGRNWVLWQAFRELESNTRDENGTTFVDSSPEKWIGEKGYTSIIVEGESFVEEYRSKDKTFLNMEARVLAYKDRDLEVYRGTSQCIYYRGLRVYDLEKPALWTYNFIKRMDLTEDRTLAYQYQIDQSISATIAGIPVSADPEQLAINREVIQSVITADKERHEGTMSWEYNYREPTAFFNQIMVENRKGGGYVSSGSFAYYSSYSPPAQSDPWGAWPRPWRHVMTQEEDGSTWFAFFDHANGEIPEAGIQFMLEQINKQKV